MPKLYEYFGLVVYFYANEHEPIHVHGEFQGAECKAELIVRDGRVARIRYSRVSGRQPLSPARLKDFKALVRSRAEDIVRRWIDFFVLHRHNPAEKITHKLP